MNACGLEEEETEYNRRWRGMVQNPNLISQLKGEHKYAQTMFMNIDSSGTQM